MEGVYGYSTEVVLIVSEVNDEGRRLAVEQRTSQTPVS